MEKESLLLHEAPRAQDPQSRPHVQDPQSRPHVQDPQSRLHVQDPQSRPHAQDPQSRPHAQISGDLLTLVLVGHTGVGKSASGNTILHREAFVSKRSFRSVTTEICPKTGTVCGHEVTVVDTPGIMSSQQDVTRLCQELMRAGTPLVFLFVLKIDRFTEEQEKALRTAMEAVGDEGLSRGLLLFSGADTLGTMTLEQFIYEDPTNPLVKVAEMFGDRVHMFYNSVRPEEKQEQEQVQQLMKKIEQMNQRSLSQSRGEESEASVTGEIPQRVGPEPALSQQQESLQELRVVLLGLPGAGKSSSGNTIPGSKQFPTGCDFDSVTSEAIRKSAHVEGRWVTVVDTPGFNNQDVGPLELYTQVLGYVKKAGKRGLNAFVIVIPLRRISKADCYLLKLMSLVLDVSQKYFTVLFTHGDDAEEQNIEDKIKSNKTVKELVSKCGGRYSVFNNKQRDDRRQVQSLFSVLEQMHTENKGQRYTMKMLQTKQQSLMNDPAKMQKFLQDNGLPQSLGSPGHSSGSDDEKWDFFKWIRSILTLIFQKISKFCPN